MFITIAAAVTVVSATLVPAVAEVVRMVEDRQRPERLLDLPTRRDRRRAP